ncbi:MAG TPA: GH3 auxin-responsive promoter family protein [Bacteroidales bacterium]|nr:GH3 auxin-responsive promoter family protein [Bacteroidales bacterium]
MIVNKLMNKIIKTRIPQIEHFMNNPLEVQNEVFEDLISSAKNTVWGKFYDYKSIKNWESFNQRLPINDYNSLLPFFERIRKGEENLLWCSEIKWFSKSAGTTASKSKFIPVSEESLQECHYKGGKDMLALYINNHEDSQIFSGNSLALGGSAQENDSNSDIFVGDVSAILIDNLPYWAEFFRTPKKEIALMPEWESKLEVMVREVSSSNVVSLSGVPSWMMVLLKGVIDYTGKSIQEVWPNLEAYFHGGVNFNPYRQQYSKLLPENINYMETYNASEGFFGLQDSKNLDSLLLLLDYGVYYEFIPFDELGTSNPKIINLSMVKKNTNYAMIISTNGGLWRYMIGDTIMFTEIKPFRFKITGRTTNFINLCGEEVIADNSDRAIQVACVATDAIISEYTAGPYLGETRYHEWVIEFDKEPNDMDKFSAILDISLQELNSDYEAKRYKNIILQKPKINVVEKGTFYNWLKNKGKLGGQNKIPRLANNRECLDEILKLINK